MILPRSHLVDRWERMKSSYWFVPTVMFIAAVTLAVTALALDVHFEDVWVGLVPWFPKVEGDGARSILSTIASSVVTVAGVVFSITIVALQLASSQFGPRLLRTFMSSLGNQLVLGTFTATFIYCLIVIGTMRESIDFVPQLSTGIGILMGVTSIGVLIYFIHHVATSIRVETVIATVTEDLRQVIDTMFPSELGERPAAEHQAERQAPPIDGETRPVRARAAGYIRHVDEAMLISAASEHDLVLRLERRPGDFVVEGAVLACAWPAERAGDAALDKIGESVVLGPDRTPKQDLAFALRQLVEIALRALSPGLNDPYTAIECVNRLGEGLCRAVRRHPPSPFRVDRDGRLRVIAEPMDLRAMVGSAFDPIARAGGGNGDVAARLIETVLMVASCAGREEDRAVLIDFAHALKRQCESQMSLDRDRAALAERFRSALAELDECLAKTPAAGSEENDRTPLRTGMETV